MKKLLLICILTGITAGAGAEPFPAADFTVKAKAAVLKNAQSGQVIFAQDQDRPIPPASLAKIMTLYLAFDAVDDGLVTLSDQVRISSKAWKTSGSKMFLRADTEVPLAMLLQGIAVVSANDACVAVAEYIAGVEEVFVKKMNRKAAELGMNHTVFVNSHGLPAKGQVTTARDIATLAYNYLRNHPQALKNHGIKEMTYSNITQRNRNGLLWYDNSVDGLKTGWFTEAGFHIIATAARNGDRFIAVVMGGTSERQRENVALQLLNYGFKNFATIQIPEENVRAVVPVWKGVRGEVLLGVSHKLLITVPNDLKDSVYVEKDVPERLFAPVEKGRRLGQIRVLVGDKKLKTADLLALESVAKGGFFKSAGHGIILFFIDPPYWGVFMALFIVVIVVLVGLLPGRKRKKKDDGSHLDSLIT